GWGEAAFAVGGEFHAGGVEGFAVPELAGDLAVALVEGLAVVGVEAEADLIAVAAGDFPEPVGVGEGLAGKADNVGGDTREDGLRLLEIVDATGCNDWRGEAPLTDGGADASGGSQVAAEGALGIRIVGGHALVTAATGVR